MSTATASVRECVQYGAPDRLGLFGVEKLALAQRIRRPRIRLVEGNQGTLAFLAQGLDRGNQRSLSGQGAGHIFDRNAEMLAEKRVAQSDDNPRCFRSGYLVRYSLDGKVALRIQAHRAVVQVG